MAIPLRTRVRYAFSRIKPRRREYGLVIFALVAAAGLFLPWPAGGSLQVSIVGAALQIVGVLTVAVGIQDARRTFGTAGVLQSLGAHLKDVLSGPSLATASLNAQLGSVTMKMTGRAAQVHLANAALETRVDLLEKLLENIRSDFYAWRGDVNTQMRNLAADLRLETQRRDSELQRLADLVKTVQTGGLNLSLFGIGCLIAGVILTSVPRPVAALLQ